MSEPISSQPSFVRWLKKPAVLVPALLVLFVAGTQVPIFRETGQEVMAGFGDNVRWRKDFAQALEEARQSGKLVLVDFSAEWCPQCQVMDQEVWPDPEVRQAIMQGYIPVELTPDRPGNAAVAKRYQVDALPRILIVDATGKVMKDGGAMDREGMLRFLQGTATTRSTLTGVLGTD